MGSFKEVKSIFIHTMGLTWQKNRWLREFSTYGIGGPILFFSTVSQIEDMEEGFFFAKKQCLPYFILGRGSNCLFDDRGFEGIVLFNQIDFLSFEGNVVKVGSGTSLSKLGIRTAQKGLGGLEFTCGIPGSVGGGVYMNAGAHGKEVSDALKSVLYLAPSGSQKEFLKKEIFFGYRSSLFQQMKGAIISATFQLATNHQARILQSKMIKQRALTQPLKEKSIGSIFCNPDISNSEGMSAGKLIERCGLKGTRVGGITVSEMHANFFVNRDNGSAKDVEYLIDLVQNEVFRKTGVRLKTEIQIIKL